MCMFISEIIIVDDFLIGESFEMFYSSNSV